jgi:hypothetical protein
MARRPGGPAPPPDGLVELVRTDRLLSPEGTTTLGRLRLEGRAG